MPDTNTEPSADTVKTLIRRALLVMVTFAAMLGGPPPAPHVAVSRPVSRSR